MTSMEHSEGNGIDFQPPPWMPRQPTDIRDILTNYLRARREAGFAYVKARDIREDLDWDPMPQKIGTNLRELEKEGAVEKWSNGPGAAYRITVEEGGEDGD